MRYTKLTIILTVNILCGGIKSVSQTLDPTTPYYQKIVSQGFNPATVTDLSAENTIAIDEPSCAYINVTKMPTTKTADMHALFDCYDGNGHYFQKKVILNAQGNSSLFLVKKNFAADFCEDEWLGDKTTNISIGNWVTQDAFHFKAYYPDFFRGVGAIGYKLFDDIVADHDSYLDRAGFTEYDVKARCYPDGFPCIVYLNGDYYGIFAWQLKKHRKNTNQTKDNANHIHLDGTLSYDYIWKKSVDWSQFEIRNPKGLKCSTPISISGYKYTEITDNEAEIAVMGDSWVDAPSNPKDMTSEELSDSSSLYYKYVTNKGKIKYYKLTELCGYDYADYDGDKPSELIDENSEYFNASNPDHVRTATVKSNILRLNGYWAELSALRYSNVDDAIIRAAIAERFDVTGIIDYYIFSLVTANYDGFIKNWQWLTYDGVKWFVTPYDLDGIFGNVSSGSMVLPPNWSYVFQDYRMQELISAGPVFWIRTYFWNDIKNRYEDLRSRGILTPEHIMQYIYDWYNRVGGDETYNSEKQKWPDSYCYNELICNPNWTTTEDWTEYSAIADYDASVTYNEGDKCKMNYRIWIATGTTTGVKPYAKMGYSTPDNASRIQKWISDRLILEDSYLNYTSDTGNTTTAIDGIVLSESNMEIESIYNASGIPTKSMNSGLNIVRYKNGETKKVFNK